MGCFNVVTNQMGIPYLGSTNTTVSATSVDIALGSFRRPLPPYGYFTVRIADAIPAGTTVGNSHMRREQYGYGESNS